MSKRLEDITYDTALPQGWLDQWKGDEYDYVRTHTVWAYPEGDIFGFPMPLTRQAFDMIAKKQAINAIDQAFMDFK